MKYIDVQSISKEYAGRALFTSLSFDVYPDRKIGLIGANGCGKSTILRILLGSETPDSGSITIQPGLRIGYVPQIPVFEGNLSAREFLISHVRPLEQRLREAEQALAESSNGNIDALLRQYELARDAFDLAGGDWAEQRAERLLEQAGLLHAANTPADNLSGGEQSTLGLLHGLMSDPQLLILDEPGNHLDYQGLAWLESFLVSFKGAVLLVSHNRYLLDRVCTHILELEQGSLSSYTGNYSASRIERLKNASAQQASWAADARKVDRIQEMVNRFAQIAASRPDPAWGKRLRAARTRLAQEKERATQRPELDNRKIRPELAGGEGKGDLAIQIRSYSKTMGGRKLFDNASLDISRGDRVAFLGPNGCGKTTLLDELVHGGSWDHPHLRIVDSLRIGYLRQEPGLGNPNHSLEDEVRGWGPLSRDQAFSLLRPMNFKYEDMDKTLASLSGGERNRLQLARIMYEKPDIIIMDEPTNHLDIPSREALEDAFEDYQGTLVMVSHDRYFLDKLARGIAEIADARIQLYEGSFSEYYHNRGYALLRSGGRVQDRGKERTTGASSRPGAAGKGGSQGARSAEKQTISLERRIEEAEDRRRELEAAIKKALEHGDHGKARDLSVRLEKLGKMLSGLYGQWERII